MAEHISGMPAIGGPTSDSTAASIMASVMWASGMRGATGTTASSPITDSFAFKPKAKGKKTVMARATNIIGQSQTTELIHNPAGYHHNVIHSITFNVA